MIIGHHHPGLGGCQRVLIDGHRGTTGHRRSYHFFGGAKNSFQTKVYSANPCFISAKIYTKQKIQQKQLKKRQGPLPPPPLCYAYDTGGLKCYLSWQTLSF